MARECYTASMKQKAVDNVNVDELDMRDKVLTRPEPSEELEPVSLDEDPEHLAYIGSKLAKDLKSLLIQFLRQNRDVFAWKQADMGGIDPAVITHRLNTSPSFKPVKQKRRSFAPERQKAINEEVGKLLQAGAIREVEYPKWLANVVLVKKANGKWRLCIDFTDINKACPKDSFPLPRIDLIVDAAAGHELLSFMDAFSGYNHINMDPDDQEKTSFVTAQGTYCYRVMPFGLKNAGATYQRLVNRMFQKQIGTTMEVYIDDMLVKSTTAEIHIAHLFEAFQILRNYNMKLNPAKCAFGVSAGKFLGFIVNHRGIEANPNKIKAQGSGAGLILTSPEGIDIEYTLRFGFRTSNNEAEYEAVIAGLNLAHSLEVDQLEVYNDSQLVVRQIEDTYEAKSGRMILYLRKVRDLLKKFVLVQVKHVPRVENSQADALAKLATASQEDLSRSTPVEYLAEPSIDLYDVVVASVASVPSWMDPIWDYIIDGSLPDDPKEAAKIRARSARFTNHKGSLYKRGFFTPFLKCIAGKDTEYVLREVHEGICGNHIGARTLAGKVLRQGYYWPTILQDATDLVKKCRICQEHAKISRLPSEPLTSITSPWPFQQWGLDILGPLPISKGQCKFIIVAVDYFTKWAEAEPLATITEKKIRNFVWRAIICRFGIPRALVSDNGKQFDNTKFKYFYAELGIKNYYSSPAHPQSNGQAEVTIRTLKAALKTKLEDLKGNWVEYLPEVLWVYRTTQKSATWETPFSLAFGTEAVALVEVGIKSPMIELASVEHNDEALRLNLDLLDEKREQVLKRAEDYQMKTARYYNQKVKPRSYMPGDLVLKNLLPTRKNPAHGKLGPNWEGPYIISRVVRPDNYELQTEEGKSLQHTWNAEHLKRFYQ